MTAVSKARNVRWAAWLSAGAGLLALVFLVLALTQAHKMLRVRDDIYMIFPNFWEQLGFLAVALQMLALIPVALALHENITPPSRVPRRSVSAVKLMGIFSLLAVTFWQLIALASNVTLDGYVGFIETLLGVLGVWLCGINEWMHTSGTLPRRLSQFGSFVGISLVLITAVLYWGVNAAEGLRQPLSLPSNYPLLAALGFTALFGLVLLPAWAIWAARALSKPPAPASAN